jgi:tetratricopeptide (TPR) repeat protein
MPDSQRILTSVGWGYRSSVKIAGAYTPNWLDELTHPSLLMRAAFALYDVKRYEEALAAFRRLSLMSSDNTLYQGVALVWRGHMLDLLGRRDEAVAVYQRAVELNVAGTMQHSQYGMKYSPSKYAAERVKMPFARVENQDERN